MDSVKKRLTFRVRQIPAHTGHPQDLTRLLAYVLDYHEVITIRSMATSPDSFESPPTKVATVTFENRPESLPPGQSEWIFLSSKTSLSQNIIIDTHFKGFTVLNEVDSELHALDCIAVSGLAGHAFGSWTAKDTVSDFMWLRDALPHRYPRTRVMTYGYDTQLQQSESFQTIKNISLAFINKMRGLGFAEPSSKPIVFLAHSLGGIVVKQALVQMANSPALETTILPKLRRTIFFGVPNRGMKISHFLPMIKAQPNEHLVTSLQESSPYLSQLDEQFYGVTYTRGIGIISVYETKKSRTLKISSDGKWMRDGPLDILVSPESAIQHGTRDEDQHPIDKDHSNLVKFQENEDELVTVLFFLRSLYDHLTCAAQHNQIGPSAGPSCSETSLQQTESHPNSAINQAVQSGRLVTDLQRREILQSVLRNIYADETDNRFLEVDVAYGTSYDWILSSSTVNLSEWLLLGSGIFWISGKPGSGKSTAMKHIYQRCIRPSGTEDFGTVYRHEILAKYFFSQRGSTIQRSFEGLLRSILYQVLNAMDTACETIFPEWLRLDYSKKTKWSPVQLDHIWERVLDQHSIEVNILLFIDALDEFDGPVEKIARFIERSACRRPHSKTQVRVCCASRPWNVFTDQFKSCPRFQMEDHTARDIQKYVWGLMSTHEAVKPLFITKDGNGTPAVSRLIEQILGKAEGVFVWVKLVVQNLLDARTAGADLHELYEIVESLPQELEDLYSTLLQNAKRQGYHKEAYAMLEILVRAPRPLTLQEFTCVFRCATGSTLGAGVTNLRRVSNILSEAEADTMQRRIKSRCGGLVEVLVIRRRETRTQLLRISGSLVHLMHQTVKDFVVRPGFRGILEDAQSPLEFANGHSFFAKFGFVLLKSAIGTSEQNSGELFSRIPWLDPSNALHYFRLCEDAFRKAELTTGLAQSELLDGIHDDQFKAFFPQSRYHYEDAAMPDYEPRRWPICSALSFAVIMKLSIHLQTKLCRPETLQMDQGLPLLHAVIEKLHHSPYISQTAIARKLLTNGADVNQKFENLTAFQSLFRVWDPQPLSQMTIYTGQMADLLLERGSDPNSDIFYLNDNVEVFEESLSVYVHKALHLVVYQRAMVQMLLDHGADVNALNGQGQTPLDILISRLASHLADGEGRYSLSEESKIATVLKLLVEKGGRLSESSTRNWLQRKDICDLYEMDIEESNDVLEECDKSRTSPPHEDSEEWFSKVRCAVILLQSLHWFKAAALILDLEKEPLQPPYSTAGAEKSNRPKPLLPRGSSPARRSTSSVDSSESSEE